jgi:hypothetical protein
VDYLNLLQWPSMVITVLAAWFVASTHSRRREVGFWLFLVSNVMWSIWGFNAQAYALIAMQFCLAFMNIRGWIKNSESAQPDRRAK